MRTTGILPALLAGLSTLAVVEEADAASYGICIRFHVDTSDSGIGEDYYTSTTSWKARGVHVTAQAATFPWPTVWDDYASQGDGECFILTSSFSSFWLTVHAETEFGPADQRVRVTARSTRASPVAQWESQLARSSTVKPTTTRPLRALFPT